MTSGWNDDNRYEDQHGGNIQADRSGSDVGKHYTVDKQCKMRSLSSINEKKYPHTIGREFIVFIFWACALLFYPR